MIPGLISFTPPSGIPLGPLHIGFYGIGYVIAVTVLLWVSSGEAERRGIDPKRVTGSLVTVAICALIGARLYHVIDQWSVYAQNLPAIVLPPYSGLGLYGGIAGAIVGIAIEARRHGVPLWRALDVVVPGTLFAQAIARWGNFFNQELYGPPTDLPWGITIDCDHRVAQAVRDVPRGDHRVPPAVPVRVDPRCHRRIRGARAVAACTGAARRRSRLLLDDLVRRHTAVAGDVPFGLELDDPGGADGDARRRGAHRAGCRADHASPRSAR